MKASLIFCGLLSFAVVLVSPTKYFRCVGNKTPEDLNMATTDCCEKLSEPVINEGNTLQCDVKDLPSEDVAMLEGCCRSADLHHNMD